MKAHHLLIGITGFICMISGFVSYMQFGPGWDIRHLASLTLLVVGFVASTGVLIDLAHTEAENQPHK